MTDATLTPELYGPDDLGEAKAAAANAAGRDFARRAHRFQNALRIMYSLDEVWRVVDDPAAFHRDPMDAAVRMDERTWSRVYALIEARQPK